jgi:hypothetical protein
MTGLNLAHQRLHTQHIAGPGLDKPEDVVRLLGAVQAQDYPAAKWAVGLRLRNATDSDIERAFTDGRILRTHVMRPTWHFVMPEDIRWMLALTAPRVRALLAHYDRQQEVDASTIARSDDLIEKALQGGKHLTRSELGAILQQDGIKTADNPRLGHLIMHAELNAVVCSGPRRGNQHTYALLDERAPQARTLPGDEALAALTLRYFTGHGPATVKDYVWWSGLTTTDAKAGLEMVKSHLTHETIDGQTYWFSESAQFTSDPSPTAYLLPIYDEYIVGYKDRSAALDAAHTDKLDPLRCIFFGHLIIIDGQIAGSWKRTLSKNAVTLEAQPFTPLTPAQLEAYTTAAHRYAHFLNLPLALS